MKSSTSGRSCRTWNWESSNAFRCRCSLNRYEPIVTSSVVCDVVVLDLSSCLLEERVLLLVQCFYSYCHCCCHYVINFSNLRKQFCLKRDLIQRRFIDDLYWWRQRWCGDLPPLVITWSRTCFLTIRLKMSPITCSLRSSRNIWNTCSVKTAWFCCLNMNNELMWVNSNNFFVGLTVATTATVCLCDW